MEQWQIIGRVKHKGDTYIIFINKKYTKFFMKISEGGKLDYPTLTEYNELAASMIFGISGCSSTKDALTEFAKKWRLPRTNGRRQFHV